MIRSIVNPQILIDEVDANTTYVGYGNPKSATSARDWEIKKVVTSGTVTTSKWAADDAEFPHIWDNRTTLTYE